MSSISQTGNITSSLGGRRQCLGSRRASRWGARSRTFVGSIRQRRIGERGSNRICNDPADLSLHLDEMGGRREARIYADESI